MPSLEPPDVDRTDELMELEPAEVMRRYRAGMLTRREIVKLFGAIGMVAATTPLLGREAGAQCELVELFPGYPGYQGYVTGVDGVGDYACLEDLVKLKPTFDRVEEDQANANAARLIALSGTAKEWTWENWLAIEAAGNRVPTCYVCALRNAANRPQPVGVPADATDPRLLLGTYGDASIARQYAQKTGYPAYVLAKYLDDDLRALVGLFNPGRHLTAPQLLSAYDGFFDAMTTPGQFLDVRALWRNLVGQGGYFPVPATAVPDDQVYAVGAGTWALRTLISQEVYAVLMQQLRDLVQDWQLPFLRDPRGTPVLREYLQNAGIGNWI
jgi:hypothetical protein